MPGHDDGDPLGSPAALRGGPLPKRQAARVGGTVPVPLTTEDIRNGLGRNDAMSVELRRYMARNPCVLQRAATFIEQEPMVTYGGVAATFLVCTLLSWHFAMGVGMQGRTQSLLLLWVACDFAVYVRYAR